MNFFAFIGKGAGLWWRPLHKVQKHRPNRQVRRWVQLVALGGIVKKGLDIESKPFLVLFVFCSGAVPSYSSHSQNTKFISLSQSLPACRNLLFDFFYTLTLRTLIGTECFVFHYIFAMISLMICDALPTSALPFEFFIT